MEQEKTRIDWITTHDRERSATAFGLADLERSLQPLKSYRPRRILDIGCGYGGLSRFMGETVGAEEIHGIDIDVRILEEAQQKGIHARIVDVETEPLPYDDSSFDLVVSLGMFDYLPSFDGIFREINRVLKQRAHALISLPNLASWHNRLTLLLGYQPRDVEISSEALVGVHPYYRGDQPSGHIHTATVRAFVELASFHGFTPVRVTAGSWATRSKSRGPLLAIDRILSKRVTLARRFFYLGAKTQPPSAPVHDGWWQSRVDQGSDG